MSQPHPVRLPKLCLASQSPRRRQLLENLGLPFSVILPSGDEKTPTVAGLEAGTRENALMKARAVAAGLKGEFVTIGADTLVAIDGVVLGKPRDHAEAKEMLRQLSGREHTVVTGLALVDSKGKSRPSHDTSRVKFRNLSDAEIDEYVATREPHDKAGSYAVQGLGALFIERIDGSYTNVMGLPIEKLLTELAALTGIPASEWFR